MPRPSRAFLSSLLRRAPWRRVSGPVPYAAASMRDEYDAIVVGAGPRALALAYHLARDHEIGRLALLHDGPVGVDAAPRHALMRSARLAAPRLALAAASPDFAARYSRRMGIGEPYRRVGALWLAFAEADTARQAHLVHAGHLVGLDARILQPREARQIVPRLAADNVLPRPLRGALSEPEASLVDRHALALAYARAAAVSGVDIVETRLHGIACQSGRVTGIETGLGVVRSPRVLLVHPCAAPLVSAAGLDLPLVPCRPAVLLTEPAGALLDTALVSEYFGIAVAQLDDGRVLAEDIKPPAQTHTNAHDSLAARLLMLLPTFAHLAVAEQFDAESETTPDANPLIGPSDLEGLHLHLGWGLSEEAIQASAALGASWFATGEAPHFLAPFSARRFTEASGLDEPARLEVAA